MERTDDVIDMVNGKKYSDDTAFFDVVNANAKKTEEAARVDAYFAATERAVNASIKSGGVKDVKAENHRFIEERAKILRTKFILKLIALITAGTLMIGGAVYAGSKISEDIQISKATAIAVEDAREDLKWLIIEKIGNNGTVAFSSEEDLVARATILGVEDFKKLDLTSDKITEIYSLVKALEGSLGAEDARVVVDALARSISCPDAAYNDFNGYNSISDWTDRNGFSSIDEFYVTAEGEIYKAYIEDITQKTKGGK